MGKDSKPAAKGGKGGDKGGKGGGDKGGKGGAKGGDKKEAKGGAKEEKGGGSSMVSVRHIFFWNGGIFKGEREAHPLWEGEQMSRGFG